MVETLSWIGAALFGGLALSSTIQYRRDKSPTSLRLALLFAIIAACSLAAAILRWVETQPG